MNQVLDAAAEVQAFLDEQGWRSCIIGGIALLAWGEPRMTQDVDITLFTDIGDEATFVKQILTRFRWRTKDEPLKFAQTYRICLILASNGTPIDISLGALDYERQAVGRAIKQRLDQSSKKSLRVAAPEDLIVLKAFADRPKDWVDIENVLLAKRRKLNWKQIIGDLQPLCDLKEDSTIVDKLLALRGRIG
jgi:hypothetical protein